VSRKGADGRWTEPENLGHPINSFGEEMGFVIASDGKTAYFSSDMPGGFGLLDIYRVELPEAFRAIPSAWVKGIVRDQQSGRVLAQAELVFTDVHSGKVIHRSRSGPDGSFFAVLPAYSDYGLNTDKAGYLFHSAHFALSDQSRERAFELDVPLKPLRSGSRITLENVFFDTDSYALMPESFSELDRLVALMEQNQKLRISLEGHTDSEGSDRGNQLLSERRAASVQAYLVDAGISSDRLEARGYGQSRPLADNSSEEGRQQNRRTELRIL
jgi:outer membrane protein OmpA-like peptidoglycan-associated protein